MISHITNTWPWLYTDTKSLWVVVTLPISSPILPADYDTLPEGYTQGSLLLSYSSYVADVKEALQAQALGSFSPTIDILDTLVESITVTPIDNRLICGNHYQAK